MARVAISNNACTHNLGSIWGIITLHDLYNGINMIINLAFLIC